MRFVTLGAYNIEFKKDGYFPWKKRINVKAGYVAYAQDMPAGVSMFKSSLYDKLIATQVLDAYLGTKRLVYATESKIYLVNPADLAHAENSAAFQILDLPDAFNSVKIIASSNENYYLI